MSNDRVRLNRQLRQAIARAKKHNTDFTSSGGPRTGFTGHGTMQNPNTSKKANREIRGKDIR